MNRRLRLILTVVFVGLSVLFILKINNNPLLNHDLSCDVWSNFSYINARQYQTCLTWHRDDAFWGVQHIRHTAFQGLLNSSSLIVEIGGNTGLDTSRFVQLYDPYIISFEPLAQMSKDLMDKFRDNSKIEIQPYGLGDRARTISVEPFDDSNTGTSIFRKLPSKDSSKIERIRLLDIVEVINNIRKNRTRDGMIDLISINCEGCEFEILPVLVRHDLLQYFRIIQFASHMDVLRDSPCIYCQMEQVLQRTHSIQYRYVMLWEAWTLKK